MDAQELFKEIKKAQETFGKNRYAKFSGAVTVELIRKALLSHGINASHRDVFIKGVPLEIDLLIPLQGTIAEHALLYKPEDVLMVFEIKNAGSFVDETIKRIKRNFQKIKECNHKISCFYVTLYERDSFKWRITEENTGFRPYALFWHCGSKKNKKFEPRGDWERLIHDINDIILNKDL